MCSFFKSHFCSLGWRTAGWTCAEPWKFKTSSISLTGKSFTKWNLWFLWGCCILRTNPGPAGYSEGVQSLNFNLLLNISSLCVWLEAVIWLSSIWFRVQRLWRAKTALRDQSSSYRTTLNIHLCREFCFFSSLNTDTPHKSAGIVCVYIYLSVTGECPPPSYCDKRKNRDNWYKHQRRQFIF